uniref:Ig-like domain-containing protein n=1 Tax=Clastoptera arizonana TaxID=38151 RepID=A0A1B6D8N3_9HEMI
MDYLVWKNLIIFVSTMSYLLSGTLSLKLTEVRIEQHTVRGNATTLQCRFDLQGESLYSVKWYKDGNEFFRYLPRDNPPAQVFPLPGVVVDIARSNETQVTLRALSLYSTGRYRCEVSAEAPSFQTVSDHGDMVTVALPVEGPRITGGRPRYQIGDTVRVNCTSGESKPAANLNWFINGEQVNSSYLIGPKTDFIGREGLESTTLGLKFQVEARHFWKGDLKLKCLATIATVYWNSNEESVEGEKPQRSPALEVKDTSSDKSRADRVQASTGCSSHVLCSTSLILLLLLSTRTTISSQSFGR